MLPVIKRIERYVKGGKKGKRWEEAFNQIHSILIDSEKNIKKILEQRKKQGRIQDVDQAIKSIAGNAFSNALIYIFLRNKECENIKAEIFITNRKSQVKDFASISNIYIDGEVQKPDVDIIIFTIKKNGNVNKCAILSLKTSLRERAGQSYRWKLLMEIARSSNRT